LSPTHLHTAFDLNFEQLGPCKLHSTAPPLQSTYINDAVALRTSKTVIGFNGMFYDLSGQPEYALGFVYGQRFSRALARSDTIIHNNTC
jgi:hypothetical protein